MKVILSPWDKKGIVQDIKENFFEYGLLEQCKKCQHLGNKCSGQYNAPGITYFWCADYKEREK